MLSFALAIALTAIGIQVGAIVFQSGFVAPVVFAELDESAASRFLRSLFPRFFRLGIVCGALGLVALVAAGLAGGFHAPLPLLVAIAAATTALDAAALALVPAINDARDRGAAGAARFRFLHRLSVLATVIVLILGIAFIAIVATLAARPAPAGGIA